MKQKIKYIKDNLNEFYKLLADCSETDLINTDNYSIYNEPNNSWANLIFNLDLNSKPNLPFSIPLMGSPICSSKTKEILEQNYTSNGFWQGMSLNRNTLFPVSNNLEVKFNSVKSDQHFNDWFKVTTALKTRKGALNKKVFSKLYITKNTHFITGKINNITVCSCLLFIGKNTSGLFLLTVLPKFRNQGIGTELIKLVSNISIEKNINTITLQATHNSINVYQNLGFEKVGKFEYYSLV